MPDGPPWVFAPSASAVRSAYRARWGFRHETWIVELADGQRLAVQRRADGSDPTSSRLRTLRDLVRAAGVPTPEPTRRPARSADDHAIVVELPFVDAVVAAELLDTAPGAATVGRLCGTAATRLGAVDISGLDLADTWTSAERLRPAVGGWLARLPNPIPSAALAAVRTAVDRAATVMDPGQVVLAHGDLAPVNVLVRDESIVAVLDLERAQLAHRTYDAAWFAWVVTFHHPEIADVACTTFGAAAGVPTGEAALGWLWPLLLLERMAEATDERERSVWANRLGACRLEG